MKNYVLTESEKQTLIELSKKPELILSPDEQDRFYFGVDRKKHKKDIDTFIDMGCAGVQMATRFIGTVECDAHENLKKVLIDCEEKDIELLKSPVGYPARGIRTQLLDDIEADTAPKISCISNCIAPCNRGEEAKQVNLCVADRLADAYHGKIDSGLFFTGTNGYKLNEIITVKELMKKLVKGE